MKKSKAKEDLSSFYIRIGQEFLDGFKKLPYNTDRIGQSFVMKASVTAKPTVKNEVPNPSSKSQ